LLRVNAAKISWLFVDLDELSVVYGKTKLVVC
jgi:hypothetical protein